MEQVKRRNLEAECLVTFQNVLDDLTIEAAGRGYGSTNRFDAGFELIGQQRFQFGDLRVVLPDRIVIVEVESGGGLTNLVKYWPMALSAEHPILLLHAFGQGSANDYLSHLLLWDFVWTRMKTELWSQERPMLFARQFRFTQADASGLTAAASVFRDCLTQPVSTVLRGSFGFDPCN